MVGCPGIEPGMARMPADLQSTAPPLGRATRKRNEVVPILGFEPRTPALSRLCSTPELNEHVIDIEGLAPMAGIEPATGALTVRCSTG